MWVGPLSSSMRTQGWKVSGLCSEFRGMAFSDTLENVRLSSPANRQKKVCPALPCGRVSQDCAISSRSVTPAILLQDFKAGLWALVISTPFAFLSFPQTEEGILHPEISSWLTWPLLFNAFSHWFLLAVSREWFTTQPLPQTKQTQPLSERD